MVCYSTNIQFDQVIDEFYFTFGRLPCMHNVVHVYVIIEGFPRVLIGEEKEMHGLLASSNCPDTDVQIYMACRYCASIM